jgi:molybdopterin-synthase adenylyltransferase
MKAQGHHSDRQSFLGPDSDRQIGSAKIGIIGLGGGGSHVTQQLAHVGFSDYVLFDPDIVKYHNLNRLVGGTVADAKARRRKINVARRTILGLKPAATVEGHPVRWQDKPARLRNCDVVLGCTDGFNERRELEAFTRRHLIPYIDIGVDVHQAGDEPPRMAGQVIVSMPGDLCMWCMGFLTPLTVEREAVAYGKAGHRPQVVWANGVLASTAVGLVVDLLTDWTKSLRSRAYLCYDANTGHVYPHKRLEFLADCECTHYPCDEVGSPLLKAIRCRLEPTSPLCG